ncbi:MAG TPA: CCA tRNA nucleotidyltransferase [Gemmatimonadales bacterium]|nr:CCA tRNA nucleotidyltransferase [Gemmatimonadales bacterium]
MSALPPLELPGEITEIAATLEAAGYEAWCVGGALRDRLLGRPADDIDLATAAEPDVVQKLFRRTVAVGVKFGTVGVLDRNRVLHEVTTFRRDVVTDGRHAVVEYGASLDEDLARRDFTINALAYHPIRREWRDPFGGAPDLERRVVRAVGNPADRFREDYLRILRALRFAARFEFDIDPATWDAAVAMAEGLRGLSAERVRDEWTRGLETARSVERLVSLWRAVGASAIWLPALRSPYPLADGTPVPRDPLLLTVALSEDAEADWKRLRGSRAEIQRAAAAARAPAAPADSEREAVRRWLAAAGPAADDLLLLEAWRTGAVPWWKAAVDGIRAAGEPVSRGELAVDGDDLLAAGVPRGPEIGSLLDRLLEAVLADPSLNTRERLLALVESWR